jgi:hypothetical protein
MLGSLDCMHWEWKQCPKAHQGQYTGKEKQQTIVLEAIASYDFCIWNAFFGVPGSCNDINVLDRFTLVSDILKGTTPPCTWELNGETHQQGYYLTDGIYPAWSIFVSSYRQPIGQKKCYFAKKQESARKDIERAFGVLEIRFHILTIPSKLWFERDMQIIMYCCIVLHNMIIEDHLASMNSNDLLLKETLNSQETEEQTDKEPTFLSEVQLPIVLQQTLLLVLFQCLAC